MIWRHPTAQEMDHRRDLAKHEWRPGRVLHDDGAGTTRSTIDSTITIRRQ